MVQLGPDGKPLKDARGNSIPVLDEKTNHPRLKEMKYRLTENVIRNERLRMIYRMYQMAQKIVQTLEKSNRLTQYPSDIRAAQLDICPNVNMGWKERPKEEENKAAPVAVVAAAQPIA